MHTINQQPRDDNRREQVLPRLYRPIQIKRRGNVEIKDEEIYKEERQTGEKGKQ